MKEVLGLWVLVLILIGTGALAFENEPEEFRGLKWGDPPTEEMILKKEEEFQDVYTIRKDNLKLGDAKLIGIYYTFFDGQFSGVGLFFRGEDNFDLLESICRVRFGDETEKGFYHLLWQGSEAMIMLDYDMVSKIGYLALNSMPLANEYTEAKKRSEAEKAEGDW